MGSAPTSVQFGPERHVDPCLVVPSRSWEGKTYTVLFKNHSLRDPSAPAERGIGESPKVQRITKTLTVLARSITTVIDKSDVLAKPPTC